MSDPLRIPPSTALETRPFRYRRLWPFAVILVVAAILFLSGWYRALSLETIVRHRAIIEAWIDAHYAPAVAAFILIFIAWAALSVPGAFVLAVSGGILFGGLVGGVASVIGATIGATCIFLIAKSAIGEFLLRRAGPFVARLADGFRADAFYYLLFLRLVPVVPFFIVNLVPAFIGVPLSTFVVATGIGIIPTTFIYALVGAGFDSMILDQESAYKMCLAAGRADCVLEFDPKSALTPQVLGALAALGIIVLIPVVVKRFRAGRQPAAGRENP